MANMHDRLDRVFHPKVIAVVGDKKMSNFMWLNANKTFTGKVYSVQVDPNEIPHIEAMGIKNFARLTDIPEPIDYVLCAVPRNIAPFIAKDCVAADVAGVCMFTSGFAETGEATGIQLQQQIYDILAPSGIALVGPNCMGVHLPKFGMRFNEDQPHGVDGRVSFISQSGTHAINFSLQAAANGVYTSKTVSFGNGIIIDAAGYLEYLADDPETDIIGMYMEGARDGVRFARALRAAAAKKPVVAWKGGRTEAGARATQSHTSSLTSSQAIWKALFRQAGAIQVDNIDEMVDVMKAVSFTRPPAGRGVGLMAMTGGQSVVMTDAFSLAGWEVPLLHPHSYDELAKFFNIIGGSYRNPLDMGGTIGERPDNLDRLIGIMQNDPNVDMVALELNAVFLLRRWANDAMALDGLMASLRRAVQQSAKPLVAIMHPGHNEAAVVEYRQQFQTTGVPVFASFDRAARAMGKLAGVPPLEA